MCVVVGLVENRKRICLFDMPNHYIVSPDSGSVCTAQMDNTVYFFIRSESRIMGWWLWVFGWWKQEVDLVTDVRPTHKARVGFKLFHVYRHCIV